MIKLEDITVERVRRAYEKHNHKPDKHYRWWGFSPTKGYKYWCPLQVLAVDLGLSENQYESLLTAAETTEFCQAFDRSFPGLAESTPAARLGHTMRQIFVDCEQDRDHDFKLGQTCRKPISRSELVTALEENGWHLDDDGDYVLVNGYIRLREKDAEIGDMEAQISRQVSFRQARAWILNDNVAFVATDDD